MWRPRVAARSSSRSVTIVRTVANAAAAASGLPPYDEDEDEYYYPSNHLTRAMGAPVRQRK